MLSCPVVQGKPRHAIDYFALVGHQSPAQYNPADFIMDLVNQDMKVREELKEAYIKNRYTLNEQRPSVEAQQYLIGEPSGNEKELAIYEKQAMSLGAQDETSKWPIGFLAQTLILFRRNWILTSKAQLSRLNCIQALCMSILFGLLWLRMEMREDSLNDRSSFIIFMMMFWPIEVCFQGILSIPSERSVISKERASGSFRLSAYYMAKCLSESPLKLVLPGISLIISYWMANLNPSFPVFLGIWVFLLIVILVAESFGVLLGALFPTVAEAWMIGNVLIIASVLCCGYFIEHMPKWLWIWARWLSFYQYAYDACIQLLCMGGHTYQCVNGNQIHACRNETNGTFTGADALQYFQVDLHIGVNFVILLSMFLVFRVAAYMALRLIKHRDGRS